MSYDDNWDDFELSVDSLGFYTKTRGAALVEDDEISAAEEGFMDGFIDGCAL